jgi:hypothetical protein
MFRAFGVTSSVQYGTLWDLLSDVGKVSHFDLKKIIMSDCEITPAADAKQQRLTVLLVDEVDVFFKDDLFGATQGSVVSLKVASSLVKDLLFYIWANCCSVEVDQILRSCEANAVISAIPSDLKDLVLIIIKRLYQDAFRVRSNKNHEYEVRNEKILYKYLDGLIALHYGFETLFVYVKEFHEGRISVDRLERECTFSANFGTRSYSEIPLSFDLILGVTGTLKATSSMERGLLKQMYDIGIFSCMPSVYGRNKLSFQPGSERGQYQSCPKKLRIKSSSNNAFSCTDVKLCDTEADHFLELRNEVDRRRSPVNGIKRAVMIFFGSKSTLLAFYNSVHIQDLKGSTRTITEATIKCEKETTILKATEQGAITLMIREFGRGTDFKCFDTKMLEAGGVHVIQAFFAMDKSEEVQIKGRCARQGAEGSFRYVELMEKELSILSIALMLCFYTSCSMILDCRDPCKDFSLSSDDTENIRRNGNVYSFLDARREQFYEKAVESRKKIAESAEKDHYRGLAMKEALMGGTICRKELLGYLVEMNGGPSSGAYSRTGLKSQFIKERRESLLKYNKEAK